MSRRTRFLLLGLLAVGLVAAAWFAGALPGSDDPDEVQVAGRLGPTPGPDSEGYVAEKRDHLQAVAGRAPDDDAAALVSLNAYVGIPAVAELVGGGDVIRLYVRQEGQEPASLTTGGTLEGAEESLGGPCDCVYAFVVEGTTLGNLLAMQQDPLVRVADVPAPPVDDLRGWELIPILPPEDG